MDRLAAGPPALPDEPTRRRSGAADRWAARRGLPLSARSRRFVADYLRNTALLRPVCALGGLGLAAAATAATGLDLGVSGWVWLLCGYMAGCLWAEVSLARIPAGPNRVAALVPRSPDRYLTWALANLQLLLPAITVALAGAALVLDGPVTPDAVRPFTTTGTAADLRRQAVVAGWLAIVLTVATLLAQRHIVRRPQPRTEPDLVAADDVLRLSSVRLLAVAQCVAALLLATATLPYLGALTSRTGPVLVAQSAGFMIAVGLWSTRFGRRAGAAALPPPPWTEPDDVLDDDPAPPPWRVSRHPALKAAIGIAVVGGLLVGLHRWGPVNPPLTYVGAATGMHPTTDEVLLRVSIRNEALAGVEVVEVAVEPHARRWAGDSADPDPLYVAVVDDAGSPPSELVPTRLPVSVPGGALVEVTVPVVPELCATGSAGALSLLPSSSTTIVVTVRSASGRRVERRARPGAQACTDTLPSGPQPADPVTASAAITEAFAVVYDPTVEQAAKAAHIDRPGGIDIAADQARRSSFGDTVRRVRALVKQVSFDRPDHAWVRYDLQDGGMNLGRVTGEAVLVDGSWRITRETVCADLARAGGACPPLG